MTTKNEAFQAKTQLRNTLRTKRLTTLQKYNFFRHRKEKISFELFKKTYFRLDDMMKILFMDTVVSSDISVNEKMQVLEKHNLVTAYKEHVLKHLNILLFTRNPISIYYSCKHTNPLVLDSVEKYFNSIGSYSKKSLKSMQSTRVKTLYSFLLSF